MLKQTGIQLFVLNSFPHLISCLSIYFYYLNDFERSNSRFYAATPILEELILYIKLERLLINLSELSSYDIALIYVPHEGIYNKVSKYLYTSPRVAFYGDSLGVHYSSNLESLAWLNLFCSIFPVFRRLKIITLKPSRYFLSKASITTHIGSTVSLVPINQYRQIYDLFLPLYEECFIPNLIKQSNNCYPAKRRLVIFAFSRSTSSISRNSVANKLIQVLLGIRQLMGYDIFCCYHPTSDLGKVSLLKYPFEFYLLNLSRSYDTIIVVSSSTSGYAASLLSEYVTSHFSVPLCIIEILYLPMRSKLKRLLRSLRTALMVGTPFF